MVPSRRSSPAMVRPRQRRSPLWQAVADDGALEAQIGSGAHRRLDLQVGLQAAHHQPGHALFPQQGQQPGLQEGVGMAGRQHRFPTFGLHLVGEGVLGGSRVPHMQHQLAGLAELLQHPAGLAGGGPGGIDLSPGKTGILDADEQEGFPAVGSWGRLIRGRCGNGGRQQ